ncbi:peptide ABC transporter substrate-binding protein [Sneathiella chinensis]|uniref:Peptide ABC transporter substrate-binding protein n=1 Tax=Sneathiella chinensis TaxID=349750 RepID=A0ABQ5U388_9PROT|nr:peptide ABC transporter substrate-binding protein [Sneathiella chinensis]
MAASLAVAVTPTTQSVAATPDDMLVIANRIDDMVQLDPAEIFEFAGMDLSQNVYDRLVSFDPHDLSKGVVPGLAESWTLGDDGMTYTFTMKSGISFHSGNPVTAYDAEFSLRRAVLLAKTPSFILTQFGFTADNINETIKAVDDKTLVIKTDKKYAPSFVLNCLTAGIAAIVDKKLVMENEKDGDLGHEWLRTNSAGSGAYKLVKWKPGDSYILEAVPGYWRGDAKMKRVVVRHVAESATQRLMLEKGDIDVARNLSAEDVKSVESASGVAIDNDLRGRIMYFSLNQKNPVLAKPKVRQAFKYLADYKGMADSFLKGQYTVHQAFLPLTYLGELKDQPFSLNVEKAKALLAEAGHADGFEVEMIVRNAQERLDIAQSLQNTFAQAGIKLTLSVGTGKQILGRYRDRDFDIYLGAWGPDYPDPQTNADTFSHNPDNRDEAKLTGKLTWRNGWDIPEMTKMTDAAVVELDTAKRAGMYVQIQKDHQATSPFVIMFQKIEQTGRRTNVNDFITGSAVSDVHYWTVTK